MQKVTITLEEEILKFIDQQAQGNRSHYINKIFKEKYQAQIEQEMMVALQEDLNNREYEKEIAEWDNVAGDGIN